MVIFGGLEVVAAGYLIHKHNQNKKEKQRIDDEAAALQEQQYPIFPNDGRHSTSGRHRRSHSRDRHDGRDGHHRRRHSADAKYRRDDARPTRPVMSGATSAPAPAPMPVPVQMPPSSVQPPPYSAAVPPIIAQQAPPQDIKYGWTDDGPAASSSQQADGFYPPTGWPAHWEQSQAPQQPANSGARLQPPKQQGRRRDHSRGRSEPRAASASPRTSHVRFADSSVSPPPSYRSRRRD